MRPASALFLVVVGACSCASHSGLDLTMTFDSTVGDAAMAGVKTLVIKPSGDETGAFPVSPGRAVMRTERLVYRYAPATRSLAIEVDALDMAGDLVASGAAGPVEVNETGALSITLSASSSDDLGVADLSGPDLNGLDLDGVDLATFLPYPGFLGAMPSASGSNSYVTLTHPSGVSGGAVLLAMVGSIYTGSSSVAPISWSVPTGWYLLQTASLPAPHQATATWFWRYATDNDPPTYQFHCNSSSPTVGYLAAYGSTVDPEQGSGPFDGATVLTSNTAGTTVMLPTTTLGASHERLVVNAFAADDLTAIWSTPSGYTMRQHSLLLSADTTTDLAGQPVGGGQSTIAQPSRWISLVVGIRGIDSH